MCFSLTPLSLCTLFNFTADFIIGFSNRVPTFLSHQIPWFPKIFPWFFLSFHQDIEKKILFTYGLVILVYANIASLSAISWHLLKKSFYSLKKHFPQIKRFENGLKKSSLIWNLFLWFWLKTPCFSLISVTGKSLQNFPWSVGTLSNHLV